MRITVPNIQTLKVVAQTGHDTLWVDEPDVDFDFYYDNTDLLRCTSCYANSIGFYLAGDRDDEGGFNPHLIITFNAEAVGHLCEDCAMNPYDLNDNKITPDTEPF